MKRKLALVLALVLVMALFAACGGASTPDTTTPDTTTPSDTTDTADTTEPTEPVDDTVYKLVVQTHDSDTSATGQFLAELTNRMTEASDGRLEFDVFYGGALGSPMATIDMTTNGTCDIGWGLQSFYPGLFPASEVIMLPMLGLNPETGTKTFWDLYSNYDYLKAEYADFHVLLLHTNCQVPISLATKQVTEVSQFQGLNFRATAGAPTDFVTNLGGSAIGMPIGDLYSALQNSTVDGCMTDWHAIESFQLYEVIDNYLDVNAGVMSYFLLMNQDKYDSLPADLQQILDEYCGQSATEWCYQYWVDAETSSRAVAAENGGNIYTLSDTENAKLEDIATQTVTQWIEKTPDGQAIYDTVMQLMDKYST